MDGRKRKVSLEMKLREPTIVEIGLILMIVFVAINYYADFRIAYEEIELFDSIIERGDSHWEWIVYLNSTTDRLTNTTDDIWLRFDQMKFP